MNNKKIVIRTLGWGIIIFLTFMDFCFPEIFPQLTSGLGGLILISIGIILIFFDIKYAK